MVLFPFLLFGFIFSLCMVKSTFSVPFNAQTLTSCSEELFLSEMSEYESSLNELIESTSESTVSDGDSSFGDAVSSHC
jgi:hypothetical protein